MSVSLSQSGPHTHPVIPESSRGKVPDASENHASLVNGNLCLPLDECWLYVPPKLPSDPVVPITKWLRDIFDSPSSMFSHSRRNLLTRLEAILASGGPIAAYRFGGSVPSLNSPSSNHSSLQRTSHFGASENIRDVGLRRGTFALPSTGSSDSLSLMAQNGNASSTALAFNHTHQPKYSLPPQRSGSQRLVAAQSGSTSYLSQSLGLHHGTFLSGSAGKVGSCDALETTKTNVKEIARIQEDNLKADVAALAAAAAGRHGSQHSLGSYGNRSPHGSLSKLSSAPESPHSSDPHLLQSQSTLDHCDTSAPFMHRSSLDGLNITFPKLDSLGSTTPVRRDVAPYGTDSFSTKNSIDFSVFQGGVTAFGFDTRVNSLNPVALEKRTTPFATREQSQGTISSVVNGPNVAHNGIPELLEARTHFGFRPLRKLAPGYSKPPVPVTSRISSASNAQQHN